MSQFRKYVQANSSSIPPHEKLLDEAENIAAPNNGLLVAAEVERMLGKPHAARLFRNVTQDPEYIKLVTGALTKK